MVTVQRLCHLLDHDEDVWILDVRHPEEVELQAIPGAHNIHLSRVPEQSGEVPQSRPVYIFCGSGMRAMVAASLLKRQGWNNLTVLLGGLAGWNSIACPLQ